MAHKQTTWLDRPEVVARPPRIEDLRPIGLPVRDAAAYLGVSRWTIQRLRTAGELRGFHIGAASMITTESLDAYVARQRELEDGG
jgi:excisionase family DNA binding protein